MHESYSSDLLAKLQLIQDLLSEEYDISLVLVDSKGIEVTLPSKLPLECFEAENKVKRCDAYLRSLIHEASTSSDALVHCCPKGLYVNVFLTSLAPQSNPLYLVCGRTKNPTSLTKRLDILFALYSLPLYWPEKISQITQTKRTNNKSSLTQQEIKILSYIVAGLSNKDMAYKLCISESTVKTHVTHILGKLSLKNRTEAGIFAVQNGLISRPRHE